MKSGFQRCEILGKTAKVIAHIFFILGFLFLIMLSYLYFYVKLSNRVEAFGKVYWTVSFPYRNSYVWLSAILTIISFNIGFLILIYERSKKH